MHGPIGYYNLDDINISEEDKNSFAYIRSRMDWIIYTQVREKEHIATARNLYRGIRDREEFRYLEETFGIETPIELKMTPLIRSRINVLVGLLLDKVFNFHVTVNDVATVKLIEDERAEFLYSRYKAVLDRPRKKDEPLLPDKFLEDLNIALNSNFISKFEKSASHLMTFYRQSTNVAFKRKIKQFFKDALITGEAYYRIYPRAIGQDPIFEICKPENTFFSINTNHEFLKDGYESHVNAIVHREFLSRTEILNRYGEFMTQTEKDALFSNTPMMAGSHNLRHGRDLSNRYYIDNESFHRQHYGPTNDILPVYHVEYLANNEIKRPENELPDYEMVDPVEYDDDDTGDKIDPTVAYRQDRYEGIRIGFDIYLNLGKSKHITRSIGNPFKAPLTYNGIILNLRQGKPSSLCLELKDLQDTYDILTFYRDNLIANAGVDGSRVNLAAIPTALGDNFMERVLKFLALRKQGVELIDPTEEGANLFQHYGDFTASLNGNVIQAIELVKESIEKQADMISGINRYMYQAAEVRDAVENVKVGQQQTSLITKEMFEMVDEAQIHVLTDLINVGKLVYRKGLRGTYIAGMGTINFNIAPEDFCFTDYNINVVNDDLEAKRLLRLTQQIPELVKAGVIEHNVLTKIALSDSTREVRQLVDISIAKKERENNMLGKLQQQLEELKAALGEKDKAVQDLQSQVAKLDERSMGLKEKELNIRTETEKARIGLEDRKISALEKQTDQEIMKDKEVIRLEREQIYAENVGTNAREVRNDL